MDQHIFEPKIILTSNIFLLKICGPKQYWVIKIVVLQKFVAQNFESKKNKGIKSVLSLKFWSKRIRVLNDSLVHQENVGVQKKS